MLLVVDPFFFQSVEQGDLFPGRGQVDLFPLIFDLKFTQNVLSGGDDQLLGELTTAVDRLAALIDDQAGAVEDPRMIPSREKMARIPRGAKTLSNLVGAAPGVWLEEGGTTFVALPGVPAEMIRILDDSIVPKLASKSGLAVYREHRITTLARDESEVAIVLRRISRDLPEVFLKSHPTHFGSDVRMQVFASTWAADPISAEERLARSLGLIREVLGEVASDDQ